MKISPSRTQFTLYLEVNAYSCEIIISVQPPKHWYSLQHHARLPTWAIKRWQTSNKRCLSSQQNTNNSATRRVRTPKTNNSATKRVQAANTGCLGIFPSPFLQPHTYLQINLQENYLKMTLVQEKTEFQLSVPLNKYTRRDVEQGTEQTLNSIHY